MKNNSLSSDDINLFILELLQFGLKEIAQGKGSSGINMFPAELTQRMGTQYGLVAEASLTLLGKVLEKVQKGKLADPIQKIIGSYIDLYDLIQKEATSLVDYTKITRK